MTTSKSLLNRGVVACLPKEQKRLAPRLVAEMKAANVGPDNIGDAPVKMSVTFGVEIHALVANLRQWFENNQEEVVAEQAPTLIDKEVADGDS